ncbi:MAG TPA: response regulator transcription factor [Pyrinomonadaceae bacterium]|jgi:two-component system LytT family response regulator|nr:response regulator transcription factor [Pyrinomonadaceae bacterium]
MRIRALIVEDEPLSRRTLREFIADAAWVECVGEAADGRTAVELLNSLKPELVFLDVHLPEFSGLEVLERVQFDPAVVFTTAYDQYAIDAFQLGAIDYLLKPFGAKRFRETLKRVRERLQSTAKEPPLRERTRALFKEGVWLKRLFARKSNQIVPIIIDNVTRFEACDDYVAVHIEGEIHLLLLPLSDLEGRLNPQKFIRAHRSHIINLDHITLMRQYDDRRLLISLRDGTEILASRSGSQRLNGLIL